MSNKIDLSILELAVIYTSLDNYISKLEKIAVNDDIKLKGEIEITKQAQKKIKEIYLSQNGHPDYL